MRFVLPALAFLGIAVAVACSSGPPTNTIDDESSTSTAGKDSATDDTSTAAEAPPPDDTTAAPTPDTDAAASAGCAGQANGFKPAGAEANQRCCGEQMVDLKVNGNCGVCGVECPAGMACAEVKGQAGHYGCRCATDVSCRAAYGTGATCYDTNAPPAFCNCQCPGGAAKCAGQCKNGATCHDVTGINYCAYD